MNLSRNFTLEELCYSTTAKNRGIDNTPPANVIANLQYLAKEVLQPLRDYFNEPIVINSGYRSKALNLAVRGSLTSHHSFGHAADIQWTSHSKHTLWDMSKFIIKELPFTEFILEEAPHGWVHIAIARGREDEKQLKIKEVGKKVERVTLEQLIEYTSKVYGS